MEAQLKSTLKFFKLNENFISTVIGIIIIFLSVGLLFNYFKTSNLKSLSGLISSSSTDKQDANVSDGSNSSEAVVYEVKKGDNLWKIAEHFYKSGYNFVDIIKENKLNRSGAVEVGQKLTIPKVEPKKITVKEVPSIQKTESVKASIDGDTYKTVKGDSLWSVAVRAYGDGYKWTKLYEANKKLVSNPNVLYSNLDLQIPKLK